MNYNNYDNSKPTDLVVSEPDLTPLKQEATDIINKLVKENDPQKAEDLTYLFNMNQNKKTLARVNKLSDLMDTMTQQALDRFTNKPDNISNQELMSGLKVVQDLIDRGTQNTTKGPAPLIQVNQQTNNINTGDKIDNKPGSTLSRESRERVKDVVFDILKDINNKSNILSAEAEVISEDTEDN